jgi:hypothetical protein
MSVKAAREKARQAQLQRSLATPLRQPSSVHKLVPRKGKTTKKVARPTPTRPAPAELDRFVPRTYKPCYQQGESDCSRYSIRIAVENVLAPFGKADRLRFKKWSRSCPAAGDDFFHAVESFKDVFKELASKVTFDVYPKSATQRSTRNTPVPDRILVTVADIKGFLDKGDVLLLNLQNMTFKQGTIVQGPRNDKEGHCVCCVGYDEKSLFIHDSNKHDGQCKKTISLSTLLENEKQLELSKAVLEESLRWKKTLLFVSELYTVKPTI